MSAAEVGDRSGQVQMLVRVSRVDSTGKGKDPPTAEGPSIPAVRGLDAIGSKAGFSTPLEVEESPFVATAVGVGVGVGDNVKIKATPTVYATTPASANPKDLVGGSAVGSGAADREGSRATEGGASRGVTPGTGIGASRGARVFVTGVVTENLKK